MITFEAIDAGHGDAIVIRYMGDMGYERVLLIDAGPDSTGKHNEGSYSPLKERIIPRLLEIKAERDARSPDEDITAGDPELDLDLVVCTHVHDDHIDGVVRLFTGWSGNGTAAGRRRTDQSTEALAQFVFACRSRCGYRCGHGQ